MWTMLSNSLKIVATEFGQAWEQESCTQTCTDHFLDLLYMILVWCSQPCMFCTPWLQWRLQWPNSSKQQAAAIQVYFLVALRLMWSQPWSMLGQTSINHWRFQPSAAWPRLWVQGMAMLLKSGGTCRASALLG